MSETSTQPVTTDTAGVNRTSEGQITTAPATEPTPSTTPSAETPKTEPKQTESKEGESLLNVKEAPKPEGAPEAYSDYKVPEGFALDAAIKTEVDKLFKGMNLSQNDAQKLVDFYTAKTKDAFEQPFNAYQEERKEWRQQAENDPDLRGKLGPGGDVLTTVNRAINSLNDPKLASDFREAMDYTGAGDNPAFIKAFYLMAQRMTEGSHVGGRGPSVHGQTAPGRGNSQSAAATLWPNLPSVANQR